MSCPIVRFEELYAEPSRNGVYKSKEYQGTGTPVVKMHEVFDNRRIYGGDFDLDRFQLSSEELLRFHLSINDLLFARTSVVPEGVGKCSLICSIEGDPAFESNLIRVRIDENRANPAYLFYYFQSPFGRGRILAISNGVAVRTIRGSDLKNVKVELLERETQDRIASILSAYDYLSENNRRRIQLLERAARLLYREWFVHLRFPGHEHATSTDGVPEGWENKPLGDLLTLQRGFDLPVKNRKEGPYPIYASTGINGFHNVAKVVGPGVVTGRSGSLGTVMYVPGDFWPLNTALWVKEFKRVSPLFALHLLSGMKLEQ